MNEISFSNFDYFQYPDKYYFSSSNPSKSLELEFSLLTANFTNLPNVKFEEVSFFKIKLFKDSKPFFYFIYNCFPIFFSDECFRQDLHRYRYC